ncbi:hypothetical protein [Kribbella sp. CA-247076]|uniref:hypothetical protein n=1 Tax=Kribbella sp. CA-247076 TaxID=3239941 RepID=UPI003D91D2A3
MNRTRRWRIGWTRSPSVADGDKAAPLAALDRATTWLNPRPDVLRDRVLLVDFWTYTCVNWLRTAPYLRAWQQKYHEHGLLLIGVHTPEFDFEHDLDNVRRAVHELGIDYPVVVDNEYDVWTSFHNRYWPALYFVDVHGQIRHHQFGEGDYEQSEAIIQTLVAESGRDGFDAGFVQVDPTGVEAAADWTNLWSPENYLGSERTENFASPNGAVLDVGHLYAVPPELPLNAWALAGNWTITGREVVLNLPDGTIRYRFHARDLNLVMRSGHGRVPFQVRVDGGPPGAAHGVDVDAEGNGVLDAPRLYQLVRQPGPVVDRTFDVTFRTAGVRACAFTFG